MSRTTRHRVLVFNAGTATLKTALFTVDGGRCTLLYRHEQDWPEGGPASELVDTALAAVDGGVDLTAHRVVHGGRVLTGTTRVDAEVEAAIEGLVPMAPLHNARSLDIIRDIRRRLPRSPAYAVFDTAFHRSMPAEATQYALPQELTRRFGFYRYGFHGIAHAALVRALADYTHSTPDSVTAVTLQLGSGCSSCAVRCGSSIETSMGYSPLEGLIMATRCGSIDAAIVTALVRAGYSADDIDALLNRGSGLLGLAGESDMRRLLVAESEGNADAALAVAMFVRRLVATVGAEFTLLDGDGALVFGGGIGARSALIRSRVAAALACWGIRLDEHRNRAGAGLISTDGSRPVYAFATDEEQLIAADAIGMYLEDLES